MSVIKLTQEEQNSIMRVLALILWLGNVQFQELDDGNSKVAEPDVTAFVAYLMEADEALVEKVLTMRVMETQRGGRRGMSSSLGLCRSTDRLMMRRLRL